jgi:hypothetical protein
VVYFAKTGFKEERHNMQFKPVAFAPSDRHNCHLNCIRNFNAIYVGGLTGYYAPSVLDHEDLICA